MLNRGKKGLALLLSTVCLRWLPWQGPSRW